MVRALPWDVDAACKSMEQSAQMSFVWGGTRRLLGGNERRGPPFDKGDTLPPPCVGAPWPFAEHAPPLQLVPRARLAVHF